MPLYAPVHFPQSTSLCAQDSICDESQHEFRLAECFLLYPFYRTSKTHTNVEQKGDINSIFSQFDRYLGISGFWQSRPPIQSAALHACSRSMSQKHVPKEGCPVIHEKARQVALWTDESISKYETEASNS